VHSVSNVFLGMNPNSKLLSLLTEHMLMNLAEIILSYTRPALLVQCSGELLHFDGQNKWRKWRESNNFAPGNRAALFYNPVKACVYRIIEQDSKLLRIHTVDDARCGSNLPCWHWGCFVFWNGMIGGCETGYWERG